MYCVQNVTSYVAVKYFGGGIVIISNTLFPSSECNTSPVLVLKLVSAFGRLVATLPGAEPVVRLGN